MNKHFLLFISFIYICYGVDVIEVTANKLSADEKTGTIELIENVRVKKNKDELFASKIVIKLDKNREPTGYSAYGDIKFNIVTKDNKKFYGKSDEAYYDTKKDEYRLLGNSELNQENSINKVKGGEIIVNNDIGYVSITGTANKPAKIIFELESNGNKK